MRFGITTLIITIVSLSSIPFKRNNNSALIVTCAFQIHPRILLDASSSILQPRSSIVIGGGRSRSIRRHIPKTALFHDSAAASILLNSNYYQNEKRSQIIQQCNRILLSSTTNLFVGFNTHSEEAASSLEKNQMNEDEWIHFIKQQKEKEKSASQVSVGASLRERVKKFFARKSLPLEDNDKDAEDNTFVDVTASSTSKTDDTTVSKNDRLVQPISLSNNNQNKNQNLSKEQDYTMENEQANKMRELRKQQREIRQSRIQEQLKNIMNLEVTDEVRKRKEQELLEKQYEMDATQAAAKSTTDRISDSKFLDQLLTGMPSMEEIFSDNSNKPTPNDADSSTSFQSSTSDKIKEQFFKKQQDLRNIIINPKNNNSTQPPPPPSYDINSKSQEQIKAELNVQAFDAVNELRQKKNHVSSTQPNDEQFMKSRNDAYQALNYAKQPQIPEQQQQQQQQQQQANVQDLLSSDVEDITDIDDRVLEIATKDVPISKQMYRSIASKKKRLDSTNDTDDTELYEKYDSFLQKEEQMRRKMQALRNDYQNSDSNNEEQTNNSQISDSSQLSEYEKYQQKQAKLRQQMNSATIQDDYIKMDENAPNTPFFQESTTATPPTISSESNMLTNEEKDDLFSKDFFATPNLPSNRKASGMYSSLSVEMFLARKNDLLQRTNSEVTVQEVNALMEYNNTFSKLLNVQKPHIAFGALFRLEGFLVDFTPLLYKTWMKVYDNIVANIDTSDNYYYYYGSTPKPPTLDDIRISQSMEPVDAITNVFYWTNDIYDAKEIAHSFTQVIGEFLDSLSMDNDQQQQQQQQQQPLFRVNDAAEEWLAELQLVEMPCAILSYFNATLLDTILEKTGLASYFPENRITIPTTISENSNIRLQQQLLKASISLERRPDHCVVFDVTPQSAITAHDVEMRQISLMGIYPMYELNVADLTIPSVQELTVMNIRRLFSDIDFDEPLLELERESPLAQPRRATYRRWAEGDRD